MIRPQFCHRIINAFVDFITKLNPIPVRKQPLVDRRGKVFIPSRHVVGIAANRHVIDGRFLDRLKQRLELLWRFQPFIGVQQAYPWQGETWHGSVELVPLFGDEAEAWASWLTALNGRGCGRRGTDSSR